jgi:tungstate transport system substrate-binding protein
METTMRATLLVAALLAVVAGGCRPAAPSAAAARPLILATTTSTQDSGLLDVLLPRFEAAHQVKVKVIAVGTGEALAMGARGDADVLLVHSRAAEDAFMARGDGALRLDVMHNDFLLIGPPADPAQAKGLDPVAAFKRIAATGSRFVSRGDRSGTHLKEQALWQAAAVAPDGQPWYLSAGQGMAETGRIATEKRAYTLTDRATWLTLRKGLDLAPVSEGDRRLFNPYGVIVVSQRKSPRVHAEAAERFARWLVAPETQKLIGGFGVDRFGQRLYVPDAVPAAAPGSAPAP